MKNQRWENILANIEYNKTKQKIDPNHLPIEPVGLYMIGHGIVSGWNINYRPYLQYKWLQFINEPEQSEIKEQFIASGDICPETNEPIFHLKYHSKDARSINMIDDNGNVFMEFEPITK